MSGASTRELRSQEQAAKLQEKLWRARVWCNERRRADRKFRDRYSHRNSEQLFLAHIDQE